MFPASKFKSVSGVDNRHMHGVLGKRADGTQAWIPIDVSPIEIETLEDKQEHHKNFAFNKFRSDATPLDRYNGDFRGSECKAMKYPSNAVSSLHLSPGYPTTCSDSIVFSCCIWICPACVYRARISRPPLWCLFTSTSPSPPCIDLCTACSTTPPLSYFTR